MDAFREAIQWARGNDGITLHLMAKIIKEELHPEEVQVLVEFLG